MICNETRSLLLRYLAGFYPEFGGHRGPMYWERREQRALVRFDSLNVDRIQKLIAHSRRTPTERVAVANFTVRHNQDLPAVLQALADPQVKVDTWVRDEIAALYEKLLHAGFLRSCEVYDGPTLVGGVLAIQLGRCYLAETMFGIAPCASKIATWEMASWLAGAEYLFLDTQTPHRASHPVARLGEQVAPLEDYLALLQQATKGTPLYDLTLEAQREYPVT